MATVEDMAEALELIGTSPTQRRRYAGPNYVNGRATPAAPTVATIEALITPLSGKETQRLPENLRVMEVRQVFSTEELRGADANQQPDEVEYEGKWWQVHNVSDWSTLANYYRVLITRPRQ